MMSGNESEKPTGGDSLSLSPEVDTAPATSILSNRENIQSSIKHNVGAYGQTSATKLTSLTIISLIHS